MQPPAEQGLLAAHGLQLLAAHGLHVLAAQELLVAHGLQPFALHGLQPAEAQGLQLAPHALQFLLALQFLAAHGLHALQPACWVAVALQALQAVQLGPALATPAVKTAATPVAMIFFLMRLSIVTELYITSVNPE